MTLDTRIYSNNAKSVLSQSISSSATTIIVTSAVAFPVPSGGSYFLLTLDDGTNVEVIKVNASDGLTTFSNCERAQEGTTARAFSAAAKAENRATAGTFASFPRFSDVMAPIDSVEDLVTPVTSDSTTYVCADTDESNNPIVAIKQTDSTWRFTTHPQVKASGTVSGTPSSLSINLEDASTLLSSFAKGAYIVQMTSGSAVGCPRFVTSTDDAKIYFTTTLPTSPAVGDTFEIYRSASSLFAEIEASTSDSILYAIILGD